MNSKTSAGKKHLAGPRHKCRFPSTAIQKRSHRGRDVIIFMSQLVACPSCVGETRDTTPSPAPCHIVATSLCNACKATRRGTTSDPKNSRWALTGKSSPVNLKQGESQETPERHLRALILQNSPKTFNREIPRPSLASLNPMLCPLSSDSLF